MSKITNELARILENDYFAFRREVIWIKGIGMNERQFIVRTYGNADKPGSDTYHVWNRNRDTDLFDDAFTEDKTMKELMESGQLTIIDRWSAGNFLIKNKFGKTLEQLQKAIHEVSVPDGVRALLSEKDYDVFSDLYDALDLEILTAWTIPYENKRIEILAASCYDPEKMNQIDPKQWKKIVTAANRINDKAIAQLEAMEKKKIQPNWCA